MDAKANAINNKTKRYRDTNWNIYLYTSTRICDEYC